MTVLVTLPPYCIRDSGRGYDEILFDQEVDISTDETTNTANVAVCVALNLEDYAPDSFDWRDNQTLWIWYDTEEEDEV